MLLCKPFKHIVDTGDSTRTAVVVVGFIQIRPLDEDAAAVLI